MTNSFYRYVLLTPTLELVIDVSELRVGSNGYAINRKRSTNPILVS